MQLYLIAHIELCIPIWPYQGEGLQENVVQVYFQTILYASSLCDCQLRQITIYIQVVNHVHGQRAFASYVKVSVLGQTWFH